MQAVAAEFSGCAGKFLCFSLREEFQTGCFDSIILERALKLDSELRSTD
jgi:hypothetical protein